jgi:spore germination protein KA
MEKPMYPGELTDDNISAVFTGAGDFVRRVLRCGDHTLFIYSIDGLTSGADTSEYVIKPILEQLRGMTVQKLYDRALYRVVVNSVAKPCENLDDVALLLVNGFCVVLFPEVGALAFEVKTGEKRSMSGPELEHTSKGPKDAFVETVRTNTSLIRRHLRTPDLRLYETTVGRRSLTNVTVVWIDGITNPEFVDRMKKRLDSIDVDSLINPSAVEEYITGSRKTAFPLLQYTERTDRFCNGLLRGRVGLLVDGLPLGYLAPVNIGYLMDSPEDLARDYISASWVRILRYSALILSLLLPAIYVAMMQFHMQWIPHKLLSVILESKKNVPFSAPWEVLGLLLAFELLQESGIHLPQSIGQSVSIIGGIVVGTAGVEAGLISPIALIMVSIAGVCGFVIPNRDLAAAVRFWRFVLATAGAVGGLWAICASIVGLLVHLGMQKSLGVPYLYPTSASVLRKRLVTIKMRDRRMDTLDKRRQK